MAKRHSIAVTSSASSSHIDIGDCGGRLGGEQTPQSHRSFLNLHIPETNWGRRSLSQLHLPTFTFTPPALGENHRFLFGLGLRKHSHNTLHRSESMVSLCFRPLAQFINDDDYQGFQAFVDNKQLQIDDKDENGTTALILACTKGRLNFARLLLSLGADSNAEDNDGWTSLLNAAKEGYTNIVLLLLEHNADIEHRDVGSWTALMWAAYKNHLDTVLLLIERGAEVNVYGNYHISSLLWASGRGYTQIVEALITHGGKVNVGDKYGTTALVWASRKGYTDIVEILLKAGANVDTAGMYSWTALLVATQGNHIDVVNLLLEHKPNVNALDKDGCSALTIACKEGYYEIASALMSAGAYINIQDRFGDTNLIHAVKNGHRGIVENLLKKYADVDISGKDQKTAIYVAVEKGQISIVKLLLNSNPDLELGTKDNDTPLLKAVRSRNADIVQLLLDKKAKVSAADKKGDTVLHIAMRARSKGIVEILLRNPKHSQLLYRPNRAGETPYNIDINHQKTILGQIFGARRLNTNEDNENMLGYDLYSSALADILSEPSLSMPITVGLYAKWGSGKSFLLNKLRDEMKNFAREWVDPVFQFTSLMFLVLFHISLIIGTIAGLSFLSWIIGVCMGITFLLISYFFLALIWFANKRYDWDWPYNFNVNLTRKLNNFKLILQVLFCHPPGAPTYDGVSAHPIRFYFTDQTRVSSTTGGENSVVQMLGSLYDAIENDYGALATRLYRAFKPKPAKSSSTWKWRKLCCLPYVVVFEIIFLCLIVGSCALTIYLIQITLNDDRTTNKVLNFSLQIILVSDAFVLGIASVANLYTWGKLLRAVLFSQRRHLQRTISKLETLKSEGFLQALRQEVNLMKDMVKCLDSLSIQQTRLVIIVDGLDSCEQDKVLLILDTVHMLFSDANSPFIVILAIDPHVIAKAVEMNTRRLFSESNIGGHNYLNNMVHLPFYLQNSGLRKVKVAQQTSQAHRKNTNWSENEENLNSFLARSSSCRRLSSESAVMSSTEKLKPSGRKGSRKLKISESIASSIGSNLNKIGGAQDLTKMLLTDDYFSDVNPRSMRRLMNVVYVTGRLLKAFQIDFNWYRLASWINITEQWPFRTSWIIYHYDLYEDSLEDNTSLKSIFDKIRPCIPTVKDTEPLLELDRDEKKFDIFLTFHRSSLLVSDLKIFLPFTINLDPYLKKVIKEETQCLDDDGLLMTAQTRQYPTNLSHPQQSTTIPSTQLWPIETEWTSPPSKLHRRNFKKIPQIIYQSHHPPPLSTTTATINWTPQSSIGVVPLPTHTSSLLKIDTTKIRLSSLTTEGVCNLIKNIDDLNKNLILNYIEVIKNENINGRVLIYCDLDDLKNILKMSFGDWEMFKILIITMKEQELNNLIRFDDEPSTSTIKVPNTNNSSSSSSSTNNNNLSTYNQDTSTSKCDKDTGKLDQRKQSTVIEKQVTLEEQMICGALQTLNEEACEDVLEETDETKITIEDPNIPQTSIIPPSPDSLNQDYCFGIKSRTNSSSGLSEADFVLLQSSPLTHMHWQPIGISIGGDNTDIITETKSQSQSPVVERRSSIIKSTNSTNNERKKSRHVVIQADIEQRIPLIQRPTSLIIKNECKPHHSKSKDDAINIIDNPYQYTETSTTAEEIPLLLTSPQLSEFSGGKSSSSPSNHPKSMIKRQTKSELNLSDLSGINLLTPLSDKSKPKIVSESFTELNRSRSYELNDLFKRNKRKSDDSNENVTRFYDFNN